MNGAPEMHSAAEAPIMATMSGSFSRSWLSTVATTSTSFLKPLTNSGRIGRSIRRLVRVSFCDGAVSRRGKLPGLGALGEGHGGQDCGVAVAHQNGAVSLAGHAAGFDGQRTAAPFDRLAFDVKHWICLSLYPAGVFRAGADRRRFRNPLQMSGPVRPSTSDRLWPASATRARD